MAQRTYDQLLLLKDAGAVTASGAATVGGQARVLDLGTGKIESRAVVDTSALDLTSSDETYRVAIQGSTTAGFAGPVELGSRAVSAAGRSEVFFGNEVGSTIYQFVRAFLTLGGTTPSINCTVFIAKG